MSPGITFANLIALVYEAGLEPDRWSTVLERVAPFLDTAVVQLWVGDPAQKARSVAWASAMAMLIDGSRANCVD